MKQVFIYPEQFEHNFLCYVNFFGIDRQVICAYDDPDDVFVWLADSLYHISYDLPLGQWDRVKTLAHQHLETL
jgi:hypothetical protein